jgi:hypothetical protein
VAATHWESRPLAILVAMAIIENFPLMKTVDKLVGDSMGKGIYYSPNMILWAYGILNLLFLIISPVQTFRNYEFTFFFAPLWMPIVLIHFAFIRFVQSRRLQGYLKQNYVLLELRLPRDTRKTPLAMETFFANMNFGPGETTEYKKYWLGNTRPFWSFEIASIGGRVRFFVWTRAVLRRGLESYLYSQYPDMEVIEAEDYSRLFDPADFEKNSVFGEEFVKTAADPFPIKTYVDYGLDKVGTKAEEQIDPLAQMIELLGSLGPKEQLWIQYIVRLSKGEKYHGQVNKDGKPILSWKDKGLEEIDKIRTATVKKGKYTDPITGKVIETDGFPNPTKGQLETINAIERNVNKPAFDVGIRVLYTAPKEAYQGIMANFVLALFKPFSNETGGGIKLLGDYSAAFNDYPWEDPKGLGHRFVERKLVERYRRRAYYYQPYNGPWSIMSTEELATLFHIPSSSVETPGLPRIQSTSGGAPSNLPI